MKQNEIAILGGGVIGSGWAARFVLTGHHVRLYDPNEQAAGAVHEVLDQARAALGGLLSVPLPDEGDLIFTTTLDEAVKGACYIQENIPERLELKHALYRQIEALAEPTAIIASSTSGFTPAELQAGMTFPDRLIVAHPFNPVYLLPLVEVTVNDTKASEPLTRRACELLRSIGMKPLVLRQQISAHIADRLLEAVWREALWLVRDDVATTQEIDDAICYGFGLRWAQMGLFETYRIAGGTGGIRHFLSQFGPTLKLPWTKLMDVPEFDEGLVEKIAEQSDQQSGRYSIRELESIRNRNIAGFLQVLKAHHWGAGETISEWERVLRSQSFASNLAQDPSQPLTLFECRVRPEWIDYNGHMTQYRYEHVFSDATDAFLEWAGMDQAYLSRIGSWYTVEKQSRFVSETGLGNRLGVETRILGYDAKRLRLYHSMRNLDCDIEVATCDEMLIHVDLHSRKAGSASPEFLGRLEQLMQAHQSLVRPDHIGQPLRELGNGVQIKEG
ncbi:MAG: carnitine 3-dehydrogenase [Pseudomonadota bacterium]